MKKEKLERLIALSPHSEGMSAAAMIFKDGDQIEVTGSWQINHTLKAWVRKPPADDIVIILKNIIATSDTRTLLKELASKISSLTWIGGNWPQHLDETFLKKNTIRYEVGPDLLTAVWNAFAPDAGFETLKDAFNDRDEELFSVLNYLTDRCLMQFGNTEIMEMAIRDIRSLKGKPIRLSSFPELLRNANEQYRLSDFPYIEGKSDAIIQLKERIAMVAKSDITALILGETGSGKEAVAFFLHDFSPRRGKPFVAINCAGLDEHFLRSELFGHVRGAFTGAVGDRKGLVEEAEGGTLFLDEITEMPPSVQADLLRFLQTRCYRRFGSTDDRKADIRIIAAGQPELKQALASGAFRKDLYFRIADVELRTPALREVPEDIFRVIRHVLFNRHVRHGMDFDIEQKLEYFEKNREILETYPWPGNFRELVALVNLHLKLDWDVSDIIRDRSLNPLPCGAYAPPATAPGDAVKPAPNEGSPRTLTQAMSGLVNVLDEALPADDVSRAYVRAARDRWPDLALGELAKRLGLAPNTLKKRLS